MKTVLSIMRKNVAPFALHSNPRCKIELIQEMNEDVFNPLKFFELLTKRFTENPHFFYNIFFL